MNLHFSSFIKASLLLLATTVYTKPILAANPFVFTEFYLTRNLYPNKVKVSFVIWATYIILIMGCRQIKKA